jgi:hypothetical protein
LNSPPSFAAMDRHMTQLWQMDRSLYVGWPFQNQRQSFLDMVISPQRWVPPNPSFPVHIVHFSSPWPYDLVPKKCGKARHGGTQL